MNNDETRILNDVRERYREIKTQEKATLGDDQWVALWEFIENLEEIPGFVIPEPEPEPDPVTKSFWLRAVMDGSTILGFDEWIAEGGQGHALRKYRGGTVIEVEEARYRIERTNPQGTWVDDYVDVSELVEALEAWKRTLNEYRASDARFWRGDVLIAENRSDMGKSAWRKK